MSADKYPSIFSCQMKAIVHILRILDGTIQITAFVSIVYPFCAFYIDQETYFIVLKDDECRFQSNTNLK